MNLQSLFSSLAGGLGTTSLGYLIGDSLGHPGIGAGIGAAGVIPLYMLFEKLRKEQEAYEDYYDFATSEIDPENGFHVNKAKGKVYAF